jgi:hypothetical protein
VEKVEQNQRIMSEEEVQELVGTWEETGKAKWAKDFGFVSYVLGTQLYDLAHGEVSDLVHSGNSIHTELFTNLYLGMPLKEGLIYSPGSVDAYLHHTGNTGMSFGLRRTMHKESKDPIKEKTAVDLGIHTKYQPAIDAAIKADQLLNEAALSDGDNFHLGIDRSYYRTLVRISSEEKEEQFGKQRRELASRSRDIAKEKMGQLKEQRK